MSSSGLNRIDKAMPYVFGSLGGFVGQLLIPGFWLGLLVGGVAGLVLLFIYYLLRAPVVQRNELRQMILQHEATTGHKIDRTLNGN